MNPDDVKPNDSMGEWPSFDLITFHVLAEAEEAYRRHPFFKQYKKVVV